MNITVKPFSKGSSATRIAYQNSKGEYVNIDKAPNFKDFASKSYSGTYGKSSYEVEYEISEQFAHKFFVQKWTGIGSTSPRQIWEPLVK